MSEADKMFDELGYEYVDRYKNGITYFGDEDNEISFTDYKEEGKVIEISKFEGFITMQELKAINKKVEELGWNNG